MTKEEFLSKLPASIPHFGYGESKLSILEDSKSRKIACYCNKDNFRSAVRYGHTWDNLYKEMVKYLRKEGYMK